MVVGTDGIRLLKKDEGVVQFTFTEAMNYPFVASRPLAAAQIFQFLPEAIRYGLDLSGPQVSVQFLEASEELDLSYTPTVAVVYVPASRIAELQSQVLANDSMLHQYPEATVRELVSLIDQRVSIVVGNTNLIRPGLNPDPTLSGDADNDDDPAGGDISSNKPQLHAVVGAPGSLDETSGPTMKNSHANGRNAGIAVGVIGGAAAVGSLLVLVALYYRRRHCELHLQESEAVFPSNASSYHDSSCGDMHSRACSYDSNVDSLVSSILPTCGKMHSQKKQNEKGSPNPHISHPVMCENSLGWDYSSISY